MDFTSMAVFLGVFILTCSGGIVVFNRTYAFDRLVRNRLKELNPESSPPDAAEPKSAPTTLSALGAILLPANEDKIVPFVKQMRRAGFLQPRAVHTFYGVKFLLILGLPILLALMPFMCGYISLKWGLICSSAASTLGILAPNLWLESRINKRLRELRTGMPDMLDMLVMCIEGGLSFQAALQRVVADIQSAHVTLGHELTHVMRAIELGSTPGDGFKQFGQSCDFAEVRELAAVIDQSEKYGASLIKALRSHADQFRQDRQMRAEENAQKASVKILFPMLICIFPAIFVVLLGPAAFQVARLFK